MSFRDLRSLADARLVPSTEVERLTDVVARYAVAVTPAIASLIDRSDPDDPVARQFLPDPRELTVTTEENADPIGDSAHAPCEGIVHRYPDRVLLKLAQTCAVYCRFCFRRETVGPGRAEALSREALDRALTYIAENQGLWEVILSGGDPLSISPRRLQEVAERLAEISHVRVLRIHTRLPIAAPDRIESRLIDALKASTKTVFVAVHANHPRELTAEVRDACARLLEAGFCLVSQTVLLKGVNDDIDTLATLMRTFVEARIKPYYLHHPDLAPGTAHFRLSIEEGQNLVRKLLGRVSGLCQPRYVLDIPGGYGKSPIGPSYVGFDPSGTMDVTDFNGVAHRYPPSPATQAAQRRNKAEFRRSVPETMKPIDSI